MYKVVILLLVVLAVASNSSFIEMSSSLSGNCQNNEGHFLIYDKNGKHCVSVDHLKGKKRASILLEVSVSPTATAVSVSGNVVYIVQNETLLLGKYKIRFHGGIHIVTVNEKSGQIMSSGHYMTWQHGLYKDAIKSLENIQNGRYLIIIGTPEFTEHLKELNEHLTRQGSRFIDLVTYLETWVMVSRKGHKVLTEVMITKSWRTDGRSTALLSSPLSMQVAVPLLEEEPSRCTRKEKEDFCQSYEGYGDYCKCQGHWQPRGPLNVTSQGTLAVVIIASRRLPEVVRQVDQIRMSTEGDRVPILLCLDSYKQEAKDLSRLIQVKVVFNEVNHHPKGSGGRIAAQMRFCLNVSSLVFPGNTDLIILEEDLQLSPDIIPYFSQTAPLLHTDETLFCVNAFNRNAFKHTSFDLSQLYRVRGFPTYGWMISPKILNEILSHWDHELINYDWDYWMRNEVMGARSIVIPEVPRTRHLGGGGAHVTGLEQFLLHDKQMFNSKEAHAVLNIESVGRVGEKTYVHEKNVNIKNANLVRISEHPCRTPPVPKQKNNDSYVIYLDMPVEADIYKAYYVLAKCLDLNYVHPYDHLNLMYIFPYYGNQLYVVGCPTSFFCQTNDSSVIYRPTAQDVMITHKHVPFNETTTGKIKLRLKPFKLDEEIAREDTI